MRLGMSIRGQFSASDVPIRVIGVFFLDRFGWRAGVAYLDVAFSIPGVQAAKILTQCLVYKPYSYGRTDHQRPG